MFISKMFISVDWEEPTGRKSFYYLKLLFIAYSIFLPLDFEKLSSLPIKDVYISGTSLYDMAVRLQTAGLNTSSFVLEMDYEALTEKIKNASTDRIYILATYTAMINYRKYLHSKGYIKKLW